MILGKKSNYSLTTIVESDDEFSFQKVRNKIDEENVLNKSNSNELKLHSLIKENLESNKLHQSIFTETGLNELSTKCELTNKVEFTNKDILEATDILNNYISKPVLVWISNLCFNQDTTNKIFSNLLNILPNNSIIGCSKEPQTNNLILLEKMDVPMSWNPNSQIYVYKIQK
jgi:hypothetical protein